MNMLKLFDFGLVLSALGLVIVVLLDIAFDMPKVLFDILSVLFIAGGIVCVYFYKKYNRTGRNEEDSI